MCTALVNTVVHIHTNTVLLANNSEVPQLNAGWQSLKWNSSVCPTKKDKRNGKHPCKTFISCSAFVLDDHLNFAALVEMPAFFRSLKMGVMVFELTPARKEN